MSLPKEQVTKDYLVKLLENKKYKEAKLFVALVSETDEKAEIAVSQALQHCLVMKKSTPIGMAGALNLYKQLLVRCELDFMESECFDQKIHRFVYDTCLFDGKLPVDVKGKSYFVKTLNSKPSEGIEDLGATMVTLSLQIVSSFAKWYPKDFFTDQKSTFLIFYEKLKEKGVLFPDPRNHVYLKEKEFTAFMKNYQEWKARMDQLENEQTPAPPNKEAVQQKPKLAEPQKQSKMSAGSVPKYDPKIDESPVPQPIGPGKIQQKSEIEFVHSPPNLVSKIQSDPKNKLNSERLMEHRVEKIVEMTGVHAPEEPRFILGEPEPPKKVSPPSKQASKSKQASRPTSQQKQKEKLSVAKQDRDQMKASPRQPLSVRIKQKSDSLKIKKEGDPKQSSRKQIPQQNSSSHNKKSQPPANEDQFKQVNKKSQREEKPKVLRKQQTVPLKMSEPQFILSPDEIPAEPVPPKTPSKPKISPPKQEQKRHSGHQQTPTANRKVPRTQKYQPSPEQPRKRSIPKTQKRQTPFPQTHNNFLNTLSFLPPRKEEHVTGKTLSYFRHEKYRKKGDMMEELLNQTSEPVLNLIERAHLDEVIVPFLPEYFEPVNRKMEALLLQSLRVGQSGKLEPSRPFYQNSELAARLIKLPGEYILTLHNIGLDQISIGYSQKIQAKYGDQFSMLAKVSGYERKKPDEMLYWKTLSNDFVDITFSFETSDPNFKFLQFCLLINQKIIVLQLPITLLDQGKTSRSLNLQGIADFVQISGKGLKSQPFTLNPSHSFQSMSQLPPFFARNRNKDSRLVGHFTYQIEADPYTQCRVLVMVKVAGGLGNKHQIHVVYDRRVEQNEDYAKVLLELLYLLLSFTA